MGSWRRGSFGGKKVWVEVDAAGAPVVRGGRVPMRYSDKPGAKIYQAGAARIADVEGAAVHLDAGVSADAPSAGRGKAIGASGFGKAGTRSASQAAAAAQAAASLVAALPAGTTIAFTDGACKGNPGPAGSGARVELPDGRVGEASRALGVATNNVGELTAVGLALDLLDAADVPADAPVALLSDSQYANGVLTRGWKAKANGELVAELRTRLAARPGVTVHWVAGHAGVAGNERADALANDGVAGRTATVWREA